MDEGYFIAYCAGIGWKTDGQWISDDVGHLWENSWTIYAPWCEAPMHYSIVSQVCVYVFTSVLPPMAVFITELPPKSVFHYLLQYLPWQCLSQSCLQSLCFIIYFSIASHRSVYHRVASHVCVSVFTSVLPPMATSEMQGDL